MSEPTRRPRRMPRLRLSLLPWALAVILILVAAGFYARSLSTPVQRAGHPTSTVAPLPVPKPVAPTTPAAQPSTPAPTGSASASSSPSASPSTTASPSATGPAKASGKFTTAKVDVPAVGASGTMHRYSVRVETGLGARADAVARQIADVLNDPRSWAGSGDVRFSLVADPKKAEFTISLASAVTTAKTCRPVAGSCVKGSALLLEAGTWKAAPPAFANAAAWQAYLVNHGVGLVMGEGPQRCAKKGKPAPVMLNQTGDLGGCTANPWPNP